MEVHFECGNVVEIRKGIVFDFYLGLPHMYVYFISALVLIDHLP